MNRFSTEQLIDGILDDEDHEAFASTLIDIRNLPTFDGPNH